jgi:NhaP-type Na+/H+ or K+/H+ antiporter
MSEFNMAVLAVAASALIQSLLSKPLERIGLPDPLTLFLLGVALGPAGFAVLSPESWGDSMLFLEEAARLALAIGLMGVALRLPKYYVIKQWRSVSIVLGLGMIFMWLASSGLLGGILGLSAASALLIGAIVTPTDPVVASTVVTGTVAEEKLPPHLRQIISAESGANDGLAYLFVMTGIFLLALPANAPITTRVLGVLFGDVITALLMGLAIGYATGFALRKAEESDLVETPSMLMITTALALGTLAGVKLLGSDGILAVFVAGLAFDQQVGAKERQSEGRVVEGIDRFFTSPVFILFGLMAPLDAWRDLGWEGVALVAAVLVLRRLPAVVLLGGRISALPRAADGWFAGWFGPLGVAALYYATMAHREAQAPELWPIASLLVAGSVIVHGITAMPLTRLYGRHRED